MLISGIVKITYRSLQVSHNIQNNNIITTKSGEVRTGTSSYPYNLFYIYNINILSQKWGRHNKKATNQRIAHSIQPIKNSQKLCDIFW